MLKIRLLHHHVKHHTWFISLNSAFRPSSDSVLHMSPIECTEKSPLFSLISIRFGSCDEVRRLNLALVRIEKQQTTKGQKKREKILKNHSLGGFLCGRCALCLLHAEGAFNSCASCRERKVLWRIENVSILSFYLRSKAQLRHQTFHNTLNWDHEKYGVWINYDRLLEIGIAEPFFLPSSALNFGFGTVLTQKLFNRILKAVCLTFADISMWFDPN